MTPDVRAKDRSSRLPPCRFERAAVLDDRHAVAGWAVSVAARNGQRSATPSKVRAVGAVDDVPAALGELVAERVGAGEVTSLSSGSPLFQEQPSLGDLVLPPAHRPDAIEVRPEHEVRVESSQRRSSSGERRARSTSRTIGERGREVEVVVERRDEPVVEVAPGGRQGRRRRVRARSAAAVDSSPPWPASPAARPVGSVAGGAAPGAAAARPTAPSAGGGPSAGRRGREATRARGGRRRATRRSSRACGA